MGGTYKNMQMSIFVTRCSGSVGGVKASKHVSFAVQRLESIPS